MFRIESLVTMSPLRSGCLISFTLGVASTQSWSSAPSRGSVLCHSLHDEYRQLLIIEAQPFYSLMSSAWRRRRE